MADTRQKVQPARSFHKQFAALSVRVAAIEQRLAEAAAPPSRRDASLDHRNRDVDRRHAEWEAREARHKIIREFDDQEWREEMRRFQPRIDAMKRARLERLNGFLAAQGMEPEPLD